MTLKNIFVNLRVLSMRYILNCLINNPVQFDMDSNSITLHRSTTKIIASLIDKFALKPGRYAIK